MRGAEFTFQELDAMRDALRTSLSISGLDTIYKKEFREKTFQKLHSFMMGHKVKMKIAKPIINDGDGNEN